MNIALALGYLHSKNTLYRDLKPENILIGDDGYLCLNNFILSKQAKTGELLNSFCGTAEYLAPEMLKGSGHSFPIDWWALGILTYEMIVGIPPFFHKNRLRMYALIREGPITFPDA